MAINIFLYHGSDRSVPYPRCDVGTEGRDFGRCFYTTYSKVTATNWAKKNFSDKQVVNKYSIDLEQLTDGKLSVKHFDANAEWAEFVWRNRYDEKFKRPNYDIIIGPMADRGLREQFMKMRKEKLTFAQVAPSIQYDRFKSLQICFCTEYALKILNWIK